ncbi:MAG: site-specific integrase [Parabacteroides sp.]|nr:site-specific integrase [Parabacteroides sp.]
MMEINERCDLTDSMLSVIEILKEEKKRSSVHTYTAVLHSFTDFSGGREAGMQLGEVFLSGRLREYQEWLRQKGLSWNTVSTYIRTLRAVYNRLYPPGSVGYNPKLFAGMYTKVESKTKRALTVNQMQMLINTDLDLLPEDVRSALTWFILMFLFRGMPFIDLANLRKTDIKGNTIVYCRHKTGKQIVVGIPREAFDLLQRFADKNPASPYLFPILNGRLKDEWQLYRCYLEALHNINKKLEKVSKLLLPGVKISSYTARHTWAALAFYQGMSLGIISKALGHSSIRVTETYLKPFENEKVDEANDLLIASLTYLKQDCARGCTGL